ncbi:MAG: SPOR domain-containing protein [Saprospiraceae bacterium]
MNRIITILVTIFILLLLYIWISHVWGSDNPRHPRQIVEATESEILGADDTSSDMDTALTNELLGTDESTDQNYTSTSDEETNSTESAENTEEKVVEKEKEEPVKKELVKAPVTEEKKPVVTKTVPKPSPPPAVKTSQPIAKPTQVSANGDGKHMVIVGNFLQLVNANQRLQELKKAGFNDVEVVNFDLSEYHTVTAGRFDDVNEARRLVKKLKDYHKIDAYVRIGS